MKYTITNKISGKFKKVTADTLVKQLDLYIAFNPTTASTLTDKINYYNKTSFYKVSA